MAKPREGDTYELTRPEGWGSGPGMLYPGTTVTVREVVKAGEQGAHDDTEDAVVIEWGESAPVVVSTGEREPTAGELAEAQARLDAGEGRRLPRLVPEHTIQVGTVTRAISVGLEDFDAAFKRRRETGQALLSLVLFPLALLLAFARWIAASLFVGEPSNVGAGYMLDILTGRNAGPGARTTYLALLTADPADSDTISGLTEVSTAGYARQSVSWTTPSGDPRRTDNSAQLTFGPFTANPPNIPYAALLSSSSGTSGDYLEEWTLDTAKDADTGESIIVAVGALAITQD